MPYIEVSDEDAALLEMARRAGGSRGIEHALKAKALHDQLYTHKDLGPSYQKQIKTLYPDVVVDADRAAPYVAEIDSVKARMDKWEADRTAERETAENDRLQNDFNSRWNSTVKDYSLTSEGEEKLLTFMKDRKLGDPEAAAALFYKQNPNPPAAVIPTSIAPDNWARDMGIIHDPDDKNAKELIANPDRWAVNEAAAVLNEIRREAA